MLSRLARYLERGWDFHSLLGEVRDSRQNPDIPTSAVFLSMFGMHSVRLGSLNGLEQQLKIPRRWDPWVGALDGIETYKSRNRCCPQCLVRQVEVKNFSMS